MGSDGGVELVSLRLGMLGGLVGGEAVDREAIRVLVLLGGVCGWVSRGDVGERVGGFFPVDWGAVVEVYEGKGVQRCLKPL